MTNIPQYTDVDLNATGTTTILSPGADVRVFGVFMEHGGSTAEVNLEVTDGTNTAVISQPGAGGNIGGGDTLALDANNELQVNVTTAEGAALTGTVVVLTGA